MKKLLLFIFLSVSMASHALSFKYTYKDVTFKCKKVSNTEVCIVNFDKSARMVTIPNEVYFKGKTFKVKSIGLSMMLSNIHDVEELFFDEGIEDIKNDCFTMCLSLKTVILPSSLKSIGDRAFYNCKKLMSVSISNGILTIGKKAFKDNKKMVFNKPSYISENSLRMGKQMEFNPSQFDVVENKMAESSGNNENTQNVLVKKKEKSDIDINIPQTFINAENTFCIIIANENYKDAPKVDYAVNDGKVFAEYCKRTLGIPERQIRMYLNASYTEMKKAFNWINAVGGEDVSDGNAKIIIYYAGHGIPSERDNSAYIMPTDGFANDIHTCFKMQNLYADWGKLKVESVVVLLDACFSGMIRGEGEAILASRSISAIPKKDKLTGNVIAISATSGDETAMAYNDESHGLFTYCLLSSLQKSRGMANLETLFNEVSRSVTRNSLIENDKRQTPTIMISSEMGSKWKNMNLTK